MSVVGFAVAGGGSRRMGRDKALLAWNETDLLGHALARLSAVTDDVRILSGPEPRYLDRGAPVVTDGRSGAGPLAGVLAGLESAAGRAGLFLAVDLPLVPALLLGRLVDLAGGHDAVVPSSARGPEPLCAVYGPACREPIRRCLAAGTLKMTAFWPQVRLRLLDPGELSGCGDLDELFRNLNEPGDYDALRRSLDGGAAAARIRVTGVEGIMPVIEFTDNYEDLSTDQGFQFKFRCERCGDGFMSSFRTNTVGVAGSLLRGAGSLLGGVFGQAAAGAYEVQRAVGGPQHDAAVRAAVEEVKPLFRKCRRCGDWLCEQTCWNRQAELCKQCAPIAEEEESSIRAEHVRTQVTNDLFLEENQRMSAKAKQAAAKCPDCGTATLGKKFCPSCGKKLSATATAFCGGCGAKLSPGAKFCGECGAKQAE